MGLAGVCREGTHRLPPGALGRRDSERKGREQEGEERGPGPQHRPRVSLQLGAHGGDRRGK